VGIKIKSGTYSLLDNEYNEIARAVAVEYLIDGDNPTDHVTSLSFKDNSVYIRSLVFTPYKSGRACIVRETRDYETLEPSPGASYRYGPVQEWHFRERYLLLGDSLDFGFDSRKAALS
jgi:hypothetical protein